VSTRRAKNHGTRQPARNRFVWVGALFALVLMVTVFAINWEYYGLDRVQRPEHGSHQWLRPSGRVGLPLGISAAALFLLNIGYLIRKRLVRISFLGPVRWWMNVHVLTGFAGAGLVLFHSSLAPSSVLGTLALVSMEITIFTGVVGRVIYIRVPRSKEGRELEFAQVQEALAVYRDSMEQCGIHAEWLNPDMTSHRERQAGLLTLFLSLIVGGRERRREYRSLKKKIMASENLHASVAHVLPLAKAYSIHSQWFSRYYDLRGLIATWRFFHRWLAVLMLCVVAGHIVVAIRYGELGFGGGR